MNSKDIIKQIGGYSLGIIANAIISLISIPILTKFFSPEELGKINIFQIYSDIILSIAYLGMDQTYIRFYHEPIGENTSKSIATLCFLISFIGFIVISIIIIAYKQLISTQIIGYELASIPIYLIISVFSKLLFRFLNFTSRMQKNILLFSIQSISLNVGKKLSYIIVVMWHGTAEDAIAVLSIFFLLLAIVLSLIKSRKTFSLKIDLNKRVFFELIKYGIPLAPMVIISMINSNVNQLFLRRYGNFADVGIYANAINIANIILLVQSGINLFWMPFLMENYNKDLNIISKMHHMITFVLISISLTIIMFQRPIYNIFVDKAYWNSAKIFPILLISPVAMTISETIGNGYLLKKKSYWTLAIYGLSLLANIILCLLLVPSQGYFGAALANAISSIIMLLTKTCVGEKYLKCIDSYIRVVISTSLLFISAIANYIVYSSNYKYFIFISALLIVIIIYRQELRSIIYRSYDFIKEYL